MIHPIPGETKNPESESTFNQTVVAERLW